MKFVYYLLLNIIASCTMTSCGYNFMTIQYWIIIFCVMLSNIIGRVSE